MRHRSLALALLVSVVILGGLTYIGLVGDLPAPDALITRSSPDATKIYDRNGRLLYEILDPRAGRRTRVVLSEMPLHFRQAVVAVEDSNFYQNPGVDAIGIARAAVRNFQAGTIVEGGSTITQQLARDLLLSREERESRSYLRKLREAILALRLTQTFSKDQILEMYLNEVYFGNLAYGVEAAARTYFAKPARDLDLAESALLAGLLQSPYLYNPLVNLDAARARQRVVLGLMAKNGFISESDSLLAQAEPLHFSSASAATPFHAPHFVIYVRNLLEERYGAETVHQGGLKVVTTLDLDLQERAQAIIQQQLTELRRRTRDEGAPDYNVHDAALVALDPATGEILAMVGSADYFDETIEGAVNVALANRQPGSAIKPITYATAFARDYTAATVLSDVPTSFQTKENLPYEPQNYDRLWHGPISLRQALATSNNMIAVKVLDHVGLDAMIAAATSLGISTFGDSEDFGLALTLGGGEVKLLELTAAYAAFANQGQRVEPIALRSVNSEQSTVNSQQSSVNGDCSLFTVHCSLVSPQVAYLITGILSDDSARISAFGEDSVLRLSRPAAAKTGTTTDYRDNWTVGYTPDLAVGVWVGNANNDPMYKISGITGAGPIWHDFMEEALKNRPSRAFVRPEGLVDVEICDTSGLLPTEYCPRVRTEMFIAGTEPVREDDSYRALALDTATNLLWADGCRGPRVERVYRLLPPDALDWGRKQGMPEPPALDCTGRVVSVGSQVPGLKSQSSGAGNLRPATWDLSITSPAPNSVFSPSPQIPAELQRIEIAARLNTPNIVGNVSLLVDGQPIATFTRAPYRALWQLAAGEHTAQAVGVDADGQRVESDVVRFVVEH
ncbi:MAG: PBP1A family penicillin-binding protein [Chloroflexi bacterium]|nr:PBP1A family penicillin-binding protein [Chloroflexota bacterium]